MIIESERFVQSQLVDCIKIAGYPTNKLMIAIFLYFVLKPINNKKI